MVCQLTVYYYLIKQILKKYGATVPEGVFAITVDELVEKAKTLNTKKYVLKTFITAKFLKNKKLFDKKLTIMYSENFLKFIITNNYFKNVKYI